MFLNGSFKTWQQPWAKQLHTYYWSIEKTHQKIFAEESALRKIS